MVKRVSESVCLGFVYLLLFGEMLLHNALGSLGSNFQFLRSSVLVILHMHVVDINIDGTAHIQVYNTQSYNCAVLAKFVRKLVIFWRVHELLTKVECSSRDFHLPRVLE